MNVTVLKRVRKLFFHPDAPTRTARHNTRQWVRSIRMLGDKWLLHKSINRPGAGA